MIVDVSLIASKIADPMICPVKAKYFRNVLLLKARRYIIIFVLGDYMQETYACTLDRFLFLFCVFNLRHQFLTKTIRNPLNLIDC